MGKKMMPLVSAVDGVVRSVEYPEPSWGYSVTIEDADGYTYHYLHMNNDVPGTDNGQGGGMNAYAVDIERGNRVVAGQLIGWMGDSGNAEGTGPHLHFEIRKNGTAFSPFESLRVAKKITTPTPRLQLADEFLPFGNFEGGASIAIGNLDADSDLEIVAGANAGGGPHVQIFDEGVQTAKFGFFPYVQGFRGGTEVSLGDVDADGIDEIITAPGPGGGPHVKVFKPDGTMIREFLAYDAKFSGGIRITAADLNNDNKAEIITIPQKGGGPHVKVFQSDGVVLSEFFAYDPSLRMGFDIAANKTAIATAPAFGGGPHVKVFNLTGQLQAEFLAYDELHRGGMRLDMDQNRIATAPLLGGPDIRLFDLSGNKVNSDSGFEPWWIGSYDVAIRRGVVYASTGPNSRRRTSVRPVDFRSQFFNPRNPKQ